MSTEARRSAYQSAHPHGLMFHRFHSSGSKGILQGSLSPADFETILLFVGVDNILAPDKWMSRLQAGTLKPSDLCLTFDDGLRSQVDFAEPVLARYGLRAFWFVYSTVFEGGIVRSELYSQAAALMGGMDILTKALLARWPDAINILDSTDEFATYQREVLQLFPFYTEQDCQYRFLRNSEPHKDIFEKLMNQLINEHGLNMTEISRKLWMRRADLKFLVNGGHWVGLHSYNHPYAMDALPLAAQQSEYQRNYDHLTALTGRKPQSMSHPLNSYNSDTLEILASLGIECGFRSNMTAAPKTKINSNSLLMAREDSATLLNLAHQ